MNSAAGRGERSHAGAVSRAVEESCDATHLHAAAPTPPLLGGPGAGEAVGMSCAPGSGLCSGSSVTEVLGPPLPETGRLRPTPRRRPGPCRGPDPSRQGPSGSQRRSSWLTSAPPPAGMAATPPTWRQAQAQCPALKTGLSRSQVLLPLSRLQVLLPLQPAGLSAPKRESPHLQLKL